MKARKRSATARKGGKARPATPDKRVKGRARRTRPPAAATPIKWAEGYPIPRLRYAEEIPCHDFSEALRKRHGGEGSKWKWKFCKGKDGRMRRTESTPGERAWKVRQQIWRKARRGQLVIGHEDRVITLRKPTPDEIAERGREKEAIAAWCRALLVRHRGLFDADPWGDNHDLGLLLLALRDEAKGGNASARRALHFLARESLRMLQDLGRAEDVVDLARDAADWFRRWAGENPKAARDAVKWDRTVPVSVPGPRHMAEWEKAKRLVEGLEPESAQPPFIREAMPKDKRLDVASLGKPVKEWLRMIIHLRESGREPEAHWPKLSKGAAGFYAGKFCERLHARAFRERHGITEEFYARFSSKEKESKGPDNSEMGGYDYVRGRVRKLIGRMLSNGM